ncbi:MAG TPA: hypothetical protein DCL49_01385 [Candidatus Omnitrophica bacterium]|nr:hypothetical protein [Candidatus Omnitrophota bacterium]
MMPKAITRKTFVQRFFLFLIGLLSFPALSKSLVEDKESDFIKQIAATNSTEAREEENVSIIYEVKNGTPEQNLTKAIEMMGGIEKFIGKNDIVILKPNAQWWNQGMTNTNAMKGFIGLVLGMPGFSGEIIVAENHHDFDLRHASNLRGWTTNFKNGDFNFNELVQYFQDKGYGNVTKYHWCDAGPYSKVKTPKDRIKHLVNEGIKTLLNKHRGRIVSDPEDGDGYVWSDTEYSYDGKKTKMSYPIFTSKFSKTTIDFKNGAWRNGKYTGEPVKFINFAALNHHSSFAGVTSSLKNYLGIVDMTCGYIGAEPEGYVSFHYIGIPGMGGAIGTFMNTIRKADLNIVTAEWVGFASRTDTRLATRTKTILASTDPVALDYYGAKNILFPLGGSAAQLNNPDDKNGPFRKYLELCAIQGIGTLDEQKIKILSRDSHYGQ